MKEQYNQLTLLERKEIEKDLNGGKSFRLIAKTLGRSASTISREVKENRIVCAAKNKGFQCRDRNWCKVTNLCKTCIREGTYCVSCDAYDCRNFCSAFAKQGICEHCNSAPWVCNSCRKNRYGCHRSNRYVYNAQAAHKIACERRSNARQGIDMPKEKAEFALSCIKDGLSRGLSPYEISVLFEDTVRVHRSTIYRWVEAGYGGLTNLELERKVGFKPRQKRKRSVSLHSPKRRFDEFLLLSEDMRASATEMDTVCGRSCNTQCILTLIFPPTALQIWILTTHDRQGTARALEIFKLACPKALFKKLMRLVLTDNGEEFSDEDTIAHIIEENLVRGVSLFYCDPRHSEQKPHCEKNHSEGRQILVKGLFDFDELEQQDMRVVMSHINSNPRLSLGGLSPIEMFIAIYGDEGRDLLDAFGIEQIDSSELTLRPSVLDKDRERRNRPALTRL